MYIDTVCQGGMLCFVRKGSEFTKWSCKSWAINFFQALVFFWLYENCL